MNIFLICSDLQTSTDLSDNSQDHLHNIVLSNYLVDWVSVGPDMGSITLAKEIFPEAKLDAEMCWTPLQEDASIKDYEMFMDKTGFCFQQFINECKQNSYHSVAIIATGTVLKAILRRTIIPRHRQQYWVTNYKIVYELDYNFITRTATVRQIGQIK